MFYFEVEKIQEHYRGITLTQMRLQLNGQSILIHMCFVEQEMNLLQKL